MLTQGVWMWGGGGEGRARLGRAQLDLGARLQGPREPQQVSDADRSEQSSLLKAPCAQEAGRPRKQRGLGLGGADTRPELGSELGEVSAPLTQAQRRRRLWGVRAP